MSVAAHRNTVGGPDPNCAHEVSGVLSGSLRGDAGWLRADWCVCIAILLISLALVGLHERSYEKLSPIDELQHIDYVVGAGDFDVPLRNERIKQEVLREAACRSVDAPGYQGPPCGLDEYDPNDFQENGFNTAAGQFPPYYVVTGLGARALTSLGLFDSEITAARIVGAGWAAAAWSITWYVMGMWRVRRRHRAMVIGLLMFSPLIIFHASATVNADVSLMLAGAVAVLATSKWEAGRLRWWWLPLIYTALFFVEATTILAVAACSAYILVRRVLDDQLSWPQRLAPASLFVWMYVLRTEVAGRLHEAVFPSATPPPGEPGMTSAPMFEVHRTNGVSIARVLENLPSTFSPARNPYFSPPLSSQLTVAGAQLTDWLLIALLFAGAVVIGGRPDIQWWTRVTMLCLLAAGPFYTFYFAYFSNSDFNAPARFALPLVPLMAMCVASAIRTKATEVAIIGVGGYVILNTSFQLLTA